MMLRRRKSLRFRLFVGIGGKGFGPRFRHGRRRNAVVFFFFDVVVSVAVDGGVVVVNVMDIGVVFKGEDAGVVVVVVVGIAVDDADVGAVVVERRDDVGLLNDVGDGEQ